VKEAEARVREVLAAAVPRWYGEGARLASLTGPVQHSWSFQFALGVTGEAGLRRLVVKIPRWEEAPDLEAALAAGPQEATRAEYAALEAVAAAVAASGDPGLAAVVAVGYLEPLNAIVTERLDAAPLGRSLGLMPGGEGRRAAWLHAAGRWLRLYHRQVAGARPGPLDVSSLAFDLERAVDGLPRRRRALVDAVGALSRRLAAVQGVEVTLVRTHGDFNLANLLVTGDGRVAVLDPNLVPGPALADLARLLTDLRTRRIRSLTLGRVGGRGLEAAEQAFLDGYGPSDLALLPLLRAVATARRWVEMEQNLTGAGTWRRVAAWMAGRYLAAEVARLADG
jgi:aminoglycoside phosphotransferase (APT) family kinase protein